MGNGDQLCLAMMEQNIIVHSIIGETRIVDLINVIFSFSPHSQINIHSFSFSSTLFSFPCSTYFCKLKKILTTSKITNICRYLCLLFQTHDGNFHCVTKLDFWRITVPVQKKHDKLFLSHHLIGEQPSRVE